MASAPKQDTEFKRFAAKRIIIGVVIIVAVLWTLGGIMGIIERPEPIPQSSLGGSSHEAAAGEDKDAHGAAPVVASTLVKQRSDNKDAHAGSGSAGHGAGASTHKITAEQAKPVAAAHGAGQQAAAKAPHAAASHHKAAPPAEAHGKPDKAHAKAAATDAAHGGSAGNGHESAVNEAIAPKLPEVKAKGVATVEAVIGPIEFELEERFWGWRVNDLINLTDNVNNYQRGVLEVTRRAVVALNERISRTGVTDAFDPDLENATNWFMIKATKYWFPSAESKYSEGVEDLKKYSESLQADRATFYTRTDNLIPLLASFEDLLGSCDENLVKHVEEDGSQVSWFKADNYFYYAQGVAASMAPILEAIHHDFLITLETRHGIELLHHAVESLHSAAALRPWVITDSHLDGILANHRANMAAPISHARFYLGVLIKALST